MRFLQGGAGNIRVVAFLPGALAARMPTLSTDVKLDGDYARKIWEKHRLGHEALGLIQTIIDHGWCTASRPHQLDFLYVSSDPKPRHFVLGLKAARRGTETWVTTLHPTDETDLRRRLRRARKRDELIKTASWT